MNTQGKFETCFFFFFTDVLISVKATEKVCLAELLPCRAITLQSKKQRNSLNLNNLVIAI